MELLLLLHQRKPQTPPSLLCAVPTTKAPLQNQSLLLVTWIDVNRSCTGDNRRARRVEVREREKSRASRLLRRLYPIYTEAPPSSRSTTRSGATPTTRSAMTPTTSTTTPTTSATMTTTKTTKTTTSALSLLPDFLLRFSYFGHVPEISPTPPPPPSFP
jgi:hypothetical protein